MVPFGHKRGWYRVRVRVKGDDIVREGGRALRAEGLGAGGQRGWWVRVGWMDKG